MPENQEQTLTVESYKQELLDALKSAPKEESPGNSAEENVGEKAGEEGQENKEDGGDADAVREEEGEEREEVAVESKPETKSEDRLDNIERLLRKEKELVRKEYEMKQRYADADKWRSEAETMQAFRSDPIGFLENAAPELLERWVERRYARSGLAKDEPKQEEKKPQNQPPEFSKLEKEIEFLKNELAQSRNQSIINEYMGEVRSAIDEFRKSDTTREDYDIVSDYCKEHGYSLDREVLEYASQVAANTKQAPTAADSLKAIRDYIMNEINVSAKLASKKTAKKTDESEEKSVQKKTKTLSSTLKGAAVKPEDVQVSDIDSYKADLLRELRKGGKG